MASQSVLCYVVGAFAYFASKDPKDVWGDDWNDAPYEHNASTPYDDCVVVAFRGPLSTPADLAHGLNSRYSVEMINAGLTPWLRTDEWYVGKPVSIMAGTPLDAFIDLVYQAGGEVYTAVRSK